jgi:hypothetical protein
MVHRGKIRHVVIVTLFHKYDVFKDVPGKKLTKTTRKYFETASFLWHYSPRWALSSSLVRFLNQTQLDTR